jgi:glycosyltransferase involved in cell wall biosynthesis
VSSPNDNLLTYLYHVFLFWVFIVAVAIQCRYLFYTFMRIFALKEGSPLIAAQRKPVSIIICAKNEALNLSRILPVILSQRYSNDAGVELYEVIVVNDNSTDNTLQVLSGLSAQFPNLKIVNVGAATAPVLKGKKHALGIGVATATNEWLLLTDADCTPSSPRWLELMVAPLASRKEIVVGYGGYYATPGLLNAFVRWETLHTFIQYSSYILAGRPYMAVGRNLACTKAAFLKAQASPIWNKTPSGDDDLLVTIAGNSENVAIVCDPAAFTFSHTKTTWREWVAQKQRHLSTGKYYRWHTKWSLALYAASHAVSWLLFFVLLCSGTRLVPFIVTYMAFRCAAYWFVWARTARKLGEKNIFYFFPLFDLGWMLYNFAFFPFITWKNKKTWT